jgi:hypothetical protein
MAMQQDTHTTLAHDSNPFTTTLSGFKNLFSYNSRAVIGVVLANLVTGFLLLVTFSMVVLAFIALVIKHHINGIPPGITNQAANFASSLSDTSIYLTWAIGGLVVIALLTITQAVSLKVLLASSRKKTIGFGEAFRQGIKRSLPLVATMALLFAVIAGAFLLLGVIAGALVFVAFILGALYVCASLYLAFRLMFTPYAVVDGKSPIAAIKYSWAITNGHFFEAVGIAGANMLVAIVPLMLISTLAATTDTPLRGLLSILVLLIVFGGYHLLNAGVAERYVQLSNIREGLAQPTKTHLLNYLTIVFSIAAFMLLSAISPRVPRSTIPGYNQNSIPSDTSNPLNTPDQPNTPTEQSVPSYNYN